MLAEEQDQVQVQDLAVAVLVESVEVILELEVHLVEAVIQEVVAHPEQLQPLQVEVVPLLVVLQL